MYNKYEVIKILEYSHLNQDFYPCGSTHIFESIVYVWLKNHYFTKCICSSHSNKTLFMFGMNKPMNV